MSMDKFLNNTGTVREYYDRFNVLFGGKAYHLAKLQEMVYGITSLSSSSKIDHSKQVTKGSIELGFWDDGKGNVGDESEFDMRTLEVEKKSEDGEAIKSNSKKEIDDNGGDSKSEDGMASHGSFKDDDTRKEIFIDIKINSKNWEAVDSHCKGSGIINGIKIRDDIVKNGLADLVYEITDLPGRYSAMRYVEDEFFYAHASYSETVVKLECKMNQERKQRANSEKGTRSLSHLDEKSLSMLFKGDEKNENSLGCGTFDMWKWRKRKKARYIKGNVKCEVRKWHKRKTIGCKQCKFKHRKRKIDIWKWPKKKKERTGRGIREDGNWEISSELSKVGDKEEEMASKDLRYVEDQDGKNEDGNDATSCTDVQKLLGSIHDGDDLLNQQKKHKDGHFFHGVSRVKESSVERRKDTSDLKYFIQGEEVKRKMSAFEGKYLFLSFKDAKKNGVSIFYWKGFNWEWLSWKKACGIYCEVKNKEWKFDIWRWPKRKKEVISCWLDQLVTLLDRNSEIIRLKETLTRVVRSCWLLIWIGRLKISKYVMFQTLELSLNLMFSIESEPSLQCFLADLEKGRALADYHHAHIRRTMVKIDLPITRSISCALWKGGDGNTDHYCEEMTTSTDATFTIITLDRTSPAILLARLMKLPSCFIAKIRSDYKFKVSKGDQSKNNDERRLSLLPWERHADFSHLPVNCFTHDLALLREKVDFSMMWDSDQAN
ncbi:hypothetical protein Tco_0527503 [Tanacetum coccineum]